MQGQYCWWVEWWVKMPKRAPELSAIEVKRLESPGLRFVGGVGGLTLNVTGKNARSWILRVKVGGKRREIGLGGYTEVSLAQARELARADKEKIRQGIDPVEERKSARAKLVAQQKSGMTFAEAFERFFSEKVEGELKNKKHAKQWRSTIAQYAQPLLGERPIPRWHPGFRC